MIPLRAVPTLAISLLTLAFVAWAEVQSPRSNSLYAATSPTLAGSAFDSGARVPEGPQAASPPPAGRAASS